MNGGRRPPRRVGERDRALPLLLVVLAGSCGGAAMSSVVADGPVGAVVTSTAVLGLGVAVVGTGLAFLFALVQAQMDVPFKRLLHLIALVPVASPPFAVATALVVLCGPDGLSHAVLGVSYDIGGLDGLVLALALSSFPVVYLTLVGVLQRLDPSLEEAAASLGASRGEVLRSITLPTLLPGLASGFLLLFVQAIADPTTPLVIGGDVTVLSAHPVTSTGGAVPTGAVFALSLLVPAVLALLLHWCWIDQRRIFDVTRRPARCVRLVKGPVAGLVYAVVIAVALLIAVVHVTIAYGAFVAVPGADSTFTLSHFDFVLVRAESLFGGVVPTLVAGTMAFCGSAGVMIVLVARTMPAAFRAAISALHRIHPAIDEASASLGADDATTFRRITLPLIRPALLAGLAFAIARSMSTLSPIVFGTTPGEKSATLQLLVGGAARPGTTFAFCCLLMVIVLAAVGLVRWLLRDRSTHPRSRGLAVSAVTAFAGTALAGTVTGTRSKGAGRG